jgi:ABC-type phosphate/phosphonate transport system substrate-binding protein
MIAALPMYDRAELRPANDRLWACIRSRLGCGPATLSRGGDPWAYWRAPDLVLAQACGYPYRAHLHGGVTLVGAPDCGLEGCPPGYYCSVFVARADDPRTAPAEFAQARLAYNEPLSQSGWAAPRNFARSQGFAFADTVRTGGHVASARAVAEGRADIAALDAVSWRVMRAHDAFAAQLREVGRTPPTPALPYITAAGRDPAPVFDALAAAIADLAPADRAALSLRGVVRLPADAYLAIPNPPPPGD